MACDFCERQMQWSVYAAYDVDDHGTHPILGRYPAAMARVCDDHLTIFLMQDMTSLTSTKTWVVVPGERRHG